MAGARRGFILFALLLLSAQAPRAQAQPGRRVAHILMLYAHDPKAPGVVGFTHELHNELRGEWQEQVEMYQETLDFDRLGDREGWSQFATYLQNKYRGLRFDAVVAEGSMALQLAVEKFGGVFPGVPIVYGNAFEPVVDFAALPPNVTGRRIPLPFAETFALARRLQPDAKRVVIVAGAAAMDSALLVHAVRDVTPLLGGMQLEILRNWSYSSLLRSLRELPKGTFVILSSFRKDWHGQSFNSGDLIPSVTRAAAVPVYGIARNWVGDGIVGGTTMQFAAEGGRTGKLLARVLRQPRGQRLPAQEVATNATVVDWRTLQRWDLSEERLPPGTLVLHRPPSLWQRFRTAILLIIGVTAAQSALIALLTLERRKRIRAQRFVHEQATYEQVLAALKTDAVRHAPDDAPLALEDAVARIGRYSGAHSAELFVHGDRFDQPLEIVRWPREEIGTPSWPDVGAVAGTRVVIPLLSDDVLVGTLQLQGVPTDRGASAGSRERLETAADVLAAALARSRAARALAESRGQVAHIARVATMGQLGAAVSHELRQPLSSMRINAEAGALLLGQEPPDVREAREVFRTIVSDNTRAIEVIEHIRMLLRRDTGASVPVSINDICRNAAKLLQRDAESKQVTLDVTLADGLPPIRGDAVQLQQVVINLVMNAIESAAASASEHRVVLRTTERDARIELEVADSGPGLSPQVQQHLFESFFSTKKSGLGMGLAIVHQIVQGHHGQVQAQNAPGGGALFRVTLPAENVLIGAESANVA
jgi:signal transduction histidine kinase